MIGTTSGLGATSDIANRARPVRPCSRRAVKEDDRRRGAELYSPKDRKEVYLTQWVFADAIVQEVLGCAMTFRPFTFKTPAGVPYTLVLLISP